MPKSLPLLVRIARELLEFQESLNGEDGDMGQQTNGVQPPGRGRGKMFSAIEEAILKAATHDWQTAQQFAEATGQKCNNWFYAILSNLAEREWLESGRGGYRQPSAQ